MKSNNDDTPQVKLLERDFFARPTLEVAQGLLGKVLVRRSNGIVQTKIICEVEAYDGFKDQASHAFKGRTPRNEVMFGPAGIWYVYLIYGMHNMLNIVTGEKGFPAAILFRGISGIIGPGRLTKALAIDRSFNLQSAIPSSGLWLEDHGFKPTLEQIKRTPRIGVDYAGEWAEAEYRFVLENAT